MINTLNGSLTGTDTILLMVVLLFCMAASLPAKTDPTELTIDEAQVDGDRFFHIMPHSHIDVEWYWTYATTRTWTKDIFDRAMRLLKSSPDFRFTQDQVYLLRDYYNSLSSEDQLFFKKMVVEKRLALVGGMFVQPEVAEPGGESLIRQILIGQQWLQQTFGMRTPCGYFIDTFGQIPQIPQILRRSGYRYNIFWRDIPLNVDFASMPTNFYWESPDGSRILTHWMPGGYDSTKTQIRTNLQHQKSGHLLLPFGGDLARPPLVFSDIEETTAKKLASLDITDARMDVVTAPEYMEIINKQQEALPVLRCDFNPPYRAADLRGTYDGRIELKKRNRLAETALFNAEVLATVAMDKGKPYPTGQFSELWEKLLFTQFHDIIGGSHHDPVYVSAMARLQEVLDGAEQISKESFAAAFAVKPNDTITVMNTLSFPRNALVRLQMPKAALGDNKEIMLQSLTGEHVPARVTPCADASANALVEWIARDLPAMSLQNYRILDQPTIHKQPVASAANRIENEYYTVTWDTQSGDLLSIFDKKLQQELLQGRGNAIIAVQEKNPDLEGPMFFSGKEWKSSDYRAISCKTGQDALGVYFQCISEFQDCQIERTVTLLNHLARIDFHTTIKDFSGGDMLIKASFPIRIELSKIQRMYETAFCATPCPEGHYAAQTWIDYSDGDFGVALLNHGTPGYWLQGNCLELVLLRSFANYTGYRKNGLKKKVPGYEASTQTELAKEHGTHEYDYCLVSHPGTWQKGDLMASGQSYNIPVISMIGSAAPAPGFVSFTPDFIMTALKPSQDGKSIIVRGFETSGKEHKVKMILSHTIRQASKADLLEEPLEKLNIKNNKVFFSCQPHEIVTFLLR